MRYVLPYGGYRARCKVAGARSGVSSHTSLLLRLPQNLLHLRSTHSYISLASRPVGAGPGPGAASHHPFMGLPCMDMRRLPAGAW